MDNKTWDFDRWAQNYDESVKDGNWIHDGYQKALELVSLRVADRVKWRNQSMLDIGAGTGNLESLLSGFANLEITAVEPSPIMRERFKEKHGNINIYNGKLPNSLPDFGRKFDIITSTYVLHHVDYTELEKMIAILDSMVDSAGEIIVIDPMFESESFRLAHVRDLREKGFDDLADEIEDEYFHSVDQMKYCFEKKGFKLTTQRLTFYVWLIAGSKVSI